MNRGRSFGPYGCLLFLMGLGFLAAGLGSGMVPDALTSLASNAPDSNGSLSALAIWGLFTFGSLGLGSIGIKYYGIRNSTMGFGAILIICGLVGLVVHLTGGGTSNSGNAIWVVMNFVAEITGSLLITSVAAMGIGILLVLGCLLAGSDSTPSRQPARQQVPGLDGSIPFQPATTGKKKTCDKCGHDNPAWYSICEKCGCYLRASRGYGT